MAETKLVVLTVVETRLEAETTITMLSAYGIYAIAPERGRLPGIAIHVVDTDLEDAQALLADVLS